MKEDLKLRHNAHEERCLISLLNYGKKKNTGEWAFAHWGVPPGLVAVSIGVLTYVRREEFFHHRVQEFTEILLNSKH